jgi:hypothetical protein
MPLYIGMLTIYLTALKAAGLCNAGKRRHHNTCLEGTPKKEIFLHNVESRNANANGGIRIRIKTINVRSTEWIGGLRAKRKL